MKRESKEEYIERQYSKAFQYETDIISGKTVANEFIKQAIIRRKELHEEYYFNESEVKDLFKFFYYVNITHEGKVIPYEPIPWFSWCCMNLYGYYRDSELIKRLFRFATIWIGRKNSKTTNAAILALYALLKEERNPEVYFLGNTKEQAGQALRYLKQIVKDSPALAKRVKIMQYQLRTEVNGTGYAKALAAEADLLDGLSPSFSVLDEKHAMITNDLFNVIKTGTMARLNPLILTISTAGFFKDAPFYNEIEIGKKVLNKEMKDDSTFYAFYTLDNEEEVDDPNMWYKANPSLDYIISLEDMKIDFDKACQTISDKINFQVKNLNVFADAETAWIPDEDYRECFIDPDIKKLKGCKAYMGVDLSTSKDLTSIVLVVDNPETGKLEVIPRFFFPTLNNKNLIRKSGLNFEDWIEAGHITEHHAKVIDYNKLIEEVAYYNDYFDLQGIAYDQWNASTIMSQIETDLFVDLFVAPQTNTYFNLPLKYIERLVYSKQINLSKNPVLRFCFRNVVLHKDANGNIKIIKNKSKDSVDGAVALGMAVGLYMKLNWDILAAAMENYSENIELNNINNNK